MAKKSKRILIISQISPSGLTGTSVKTRSTIKHFLKKGFLVDFASIRFEALQDRPLNHKNFQIFSVFKKRGRRLHRGILFRIMEVLLTPKPFRVAKMYDRRLNALIEILEFSKEYSAVLFDGFSTLQYAQSYQDNYIYVDDEDITDLLQKRMRQEKNPIKKLFFWSEFVRCGWYEKKYLQRMKQIWAISPKTKDRLKTLSSAKTMFMPTLIEKKKNVFSKKAKNIVFTGTLHWQENQDGLEWFIKNCWEEIYADFPETKLLITGQQADGYWQDFCSRYPNIELVGYVPDLARVYGKSALAISPIFINSGIKVKILTYLSYGIPTVAIRTSTWGMSSTKGILLASKDNFSQKVKDLLSNLSARAALSKDGYRNISENHGEKKLTHFLKETRFFT